MAHLPARTRHNKIEHPWQQHQINNQSQNTAHSVWGRWWWQVGGFLGRKQHFSAARHKTANIHPHPLTQKRKKRHAVQNSVIGSFLFSSHNATHHHHHTQNSASPRGPTRKHTTERQEPINQQLPQEGGRRGRAHFPHKRNATVLFKVECRQQVPASKTN